MERNVKNYYYFIFGGKSMNNELQEHKKSDTVKWILTLVGFILVGMLLIGIILGWFEKKEVQGDQREQAQAFQTVS